MSHPVPVPTEDVPTEDVTEREDDNENFPLQQEVPQPAAQQTNLFCRRTRDICASKRFIFSCLGIGWAVAIAFFILYINLYFRQTGGEKLPTPVVLKIAVKDYKIDPYYKRMFISGNDTTPTDGETNNGPDVRWRSQNDGSDFWYLEVSPIRTSGKDCPISRNGTFGELDEVEEFNPPDKSSCNLYDFRLVIFNDLRDEFRYGATVHFHGLTPPSNQDGVPFVSNANIHPQNLQAYRFNQFTYPGLHWMHAHTGFQQAYGVAAPIVLQHSDVYFNTNKFRKEDDLVVMLEEGFIYPKCAYSTDWREAPLDHTPSATAKQIRIRFLNGGSEAPWRITNRFAETYDGNKVSMEIMATDGHDVSRGVKRDEFVLGLANRIDILLNLEEVDDSSRDILITAIQMKHSGNVTSPALRHIIIRGRNVPDDKKIIAGDLPNHDSQNSTILENFNLLANLTSAHPLSERAITRNFTIENRGGDQFGGFPLSIYQGLVQNGSNPMLSNLTNLYPVNTYTELNNLKFQLPPYKVYRNKKNSTKEVISTRRKCAGCASQSQSGIRSRPTPGEPYEILYNDKNAKGNNTCCWEWCDVPEDQCEDYNPVDVDSYQPNKHYIPVCFGDRVRILFINTASFENSEGHPMHLHGHEFVLRELYNVKENYKLVKDETYQYDISGPKLDSIWVPFNTAVVFDFDAYNAGEHLFHCHNDFHLENGMMTTVRYVHDDDYCGSSDLPDFVGGENDYPKQICTMDDCNSTKRKEL